MSSQPSCLPESCPAHLKSCKQAALPWKSNKQEFDCVADTLGHNLANPKLVYDDWNANYRISYDKDYKEIIIK